MKKILVTGLILLFSITLTQGQEKDKPKENKTKLNMKFKEGTQPDVYVDGKKFEFSIDLLDTDRIATMNVLKGKEALEVYNAPNGVILITTKEKSDEDKAKFIISDLNGNDSYEVNTKIRIRDGDKGKDPMIIIDGKEVTRKELKKLNPEDIEVIEVLKDKAAKKAYDADNGVIIVKMKKQKKVEKQEKQKKQEKSNK